MPIGNGNIGLLLYSAVNSTHSLESGKEPAITGCQRFLNMLSRVVTRDNQFTDVIVLQH